MKIAVTGSRGLIGTHVRLRLEAENHEVVEWDNKLGKDIKDFNLEQDIDAVIHLAAWADVRASIDNPEAYWENNVVNTTAIQKICHLSRVPLFYASSSCIHNWWLSPYGISKKVNEETAYSNIAHSIYQVGLRFTTVYGEGARETMLIPRLLNNNIKYLTKHIRDFIHVNDVVDVIMLLIDKSFNPEKYPGVPLKPSYDIGTGKGYAIDEIGTWTGHINTASSLPITDGDTCEAQDNTADISDLQELGWNPTIDLKNYLQEKGAIV